MEKIEFQKIMTALENRLGVCELQLGEIKTTNDLSRLTLARATDLKNFCVAEEEIMTKIVMVDLYHIIGMGELTPPQMMKFTYSIQKYLQYRPTIKAIAKHLDSIFELPKIPVATQYRLMGLGDVTLTSGFGECVTDSASVADYSQKATKLPFRIIGEYTIKVDMTQFEYFVTLMSNLLKSNLSVSNFRKKLANHGEYLGINWTDVNAYEATGIFKSVEAHKLLSNYYNNHN